MSSEWDIIEDFYGKCGGFGGFAYGDQWHEIVASFLEKIPLQKIVHFLEDASRQHDYGKLDVLCVVLRGLFNSKSGVQALGTASFVPNLLKGLDHYSHDLRRITAREIQKVGIEYFPQDYHHEIIEKMTQRLFDEDTRVAHIASDALFAHSNSGARTSVLQALASVQIDKVQFTGEPTETGLRQLHLVARIASRDGNAVMECEKFHLLDPLFQILKGDDILLQLNALKLVPLVSASDAGMNLIGKSDIVAILCAMAGLGPDAKDHDPILGVEAMRVLAFLCAKDTTTALSPELGTLFLDAMAKRFHCISSSDPNSSIPVLEMLGAFAGAQPPSSLNRLLTERTEEILLLWMKFAVLQGDLVKTAGLLSVATGMRGGAIPPEHHMSTADAFDNANDDVLGFSQLIEQASRKGVDPSARAQAAKLSEKLFLEYGEALRKSNQMKDLGQATLTSADVVRTLVNFIRYPLDDLRCAVFALLRMVAAQDDEWGLRAIYTCGPSVMETLADRSLNMSKACKEWRFAMMESIHHNPHKETVLGAKQQNDLVAFLQRGPYLGPAPGSVAPEVEVAEAAA